MLVAREDVRLSRQSSEDAYDLRQLERRERCRRRYLRTANGLYVAASVDQRASKIKLREIELAPIRGEIGAVQHIASGSLKDIPRFPGQVEQHMGGRHSRQCHCLVCLYPTGDVDDEDIAGCAAERQPGILDVGHVDDIQTVVTVDYLSVVDVAERLGGGQRGSVVGNILRGSARSGSNAVCAAMGEMRRFRTFPVSPHNGEVRPFSATQAPRRQRLLLPPTRPLPAAAGWLGRVGSRHRLDAEGADLKCSNHARTSVNEIRV